LDVASNAFLLQNEEQQIFFILINAIYNY